MEPVSRLSKVAPIGFALLVAVIASGCGPATRALTGISETGSGPVVTLYVCDNEPHLTVRIYTGPADTNYYTLTGSARRHQAVQIPLTVGSPDWRLTGVRQTLVAGRKIEADAEDGGGNRLGSAVYFTTDAIPTSPNVGVGDGPLKALSADEFLKSARRVC